MSWSNPRVCVIHRWFPLAHVARTDGFEGRIAVESDVASAREGPQIVTTSYGVLSTYPPTQCGLASFSRALVGSLRSPSDRVGVAAVVDSFQPDFPAEVRHQWVRGEASGAAATAVYLNTFDVVIVQHEYGIFGGPDGAEVLDVVRSLTAPVVVVLHTVLAAPTMRQRAILDELVLRSERVVTMTQTARRRLIDHYRTEPAKVRVVPHGADAGHGLAPERRDEVNQRPMILTWGLLGAGKGIEWGISAMAALRDIDPTPRYHVVGETHPKVVQREGEAYRESLQARALSLGVEELVTFDARYIAPEELHRIVQAADVVLLPYDSRDQVTSGVLVEAVTAGKPVVSTGFPHAVELLSGGAGLIVDRQNPTSIAAALRRVLTEPGLADRMSSHARRLAPELSWSAVAERYRVLAAGVLDLDLARVSA
jgi:glycosyltransferase involved in cell wall biosynthesis